MKTRLQNVMEAHEVTKTDLIRGLNVVFEGNIYDFVENLVKEEDLAIYGGLAIRTVAEICNCSTDYLLGISDVMNPMNNWGL